MANFIIRMTFMQAAKGFYTWLDAVKQFNTRRRFMKNVINHLSRLALSKAFKTWSEKSYAIKQGQLAKELGNKEAEKRKLIEEHKENAN